MENQERIRALKYAFPRTVPVMAGYLVLGAAYGILMNISITADKKKHPAAMDSTG